VKEIANIVYSTINNNTIIKSINGEHILRTKTSKGEWQCRKIHLIYLKECSKKSFNVLLGFINQDIINSENKLNITSRERQVFKFLSKGYSAKMIAESLNISENTVITHRKNLIHKLNVKNSAELIKKGFELSLNY
jgi:DNA-binding NarL/FixJ family response regulator